MMRILVILICCAGLAGCGEYREYTPPSDPAGIAGEDFTSKDADRYKATDPVKQWWTRFNDPVLSTLIEDGITHNLDVQIALARVLESRAVASASELDRFPTVEAFFDYRRQQLTEEGTTLPSADRRFNSYDAGFDLSWEIDIFGRVANRIERDQALTGARLSDLRGVYVAVTSEIARAYIDLRGAQMRLDIARRNAGNQRKTYDLTRTLLNGGSATSLDVARARTQLKLTQATIPPLEAAEKAAIYRLGVLTGKVPKTLETLLSDQQPLPNLPESIGVGSPEDLLRRRPDIKAAERRLAASVSQYNIAVADLFPDVNILGVINFGSTSLSDFGQGSAVEYSVGPTLRWAAFDLGTVRARINQEDAASFRVLKEYELTVLQALEEVHNALTAFGTEDRRLRDLREAAASSAEAARIARRRFEAGLDNFIDVLDAERTLLEAQDARAVSTIETARNLIDIYRALGGGWQMITQAPDGQGGWKGLKLSPVRDTKNGIDE